MILIEKNHLGMNYLNLTVIENHPISNALLITMKKIRIITTPLLSQI